MKPKILFVDDESQILESLADVWGFDYDVATASDGAQALELLATWIPEVIVSDMRMPGMDGATFLASARARVPSATRILLTGQSDLEAASRAVNEGGIFKLLTKPCPHDLMAAALIEALAVNAQQARAAQLTERMAQTEQLATLGTMSAALGHEMNNAISLIGCAIESVEEAVGEARLPDAESVEQLVRGRERLIAQARGAMSLGRRSHRELAQIDLHEALDSLLATIRASGIARRAELALRVDTEVQIRADRTELDQVMLNLVKNALDALPDGRGRVQIGVRRHGDEVEITVDDTGAGISPRDLGKVFDPFFTTKPPSQGTGLGLPVAKQIICAYGGAIAIASQVGQGTRVTIELPVAA